MKKNSRGKGSVLSHLVGVAGMLLLLHAGYCTILYRNELNDMEEKFESPPFNVMFELFVGLVLCLVAALQVPGTFQPIKLEAENNRIVELPELADFMVFSHRGRILSSKTGRKTKDN